MEDDLKNLRKRMKKTRFNELKFTEQHRMTVLKQIQQEEAEADILHLVMQLLVQEKTGYKLTEQLRVRGVKKFEGNEGFLYTLLHQLEQKGYLDAAWNKGDMKLYQLNRKGRKLLEKAEKEKDRKNVILGLLAEVKGR